MTAAGAARSLPLGSTIGDFGLRVDGYTPPPGTGAKGDWQIVTAGYMEAIGEQVLRGRGIERTDTSDSQLVGLINEEMARRYWAGRDPIGGRFAIGQRPDRPWITVVGIVKDVRHNGITDVVKEKFYIPHTQWHRSLGNANLIRAHDAGGPDRGHAVGADVPGQGRDPSDGSEPSRGRRADDGGRRGRRMATPRFTSVLLSIFAILALTLSAVGIYGVLSYVVSRRTREIGIRVAIGAGRVQVLRMVLGSGVSLALVGIAAGSCSPSA